jgi:large subunit ribosomal protein L19
MPEDTKKQPEEKKEDKPEEGSKPVDKEPKKEVKEEPKEPVEEKEEPKKEVEIPDFRVGDTVKLQYRIIEGEKTRLQPFQGIVISKRGEGVSKTFTVRRIGADKIGVERIFPLHSPNIEELIVVKKGKVRKAKLYYLRDKKGREAMRIKERK